MVILYYNYKHNFWYLSHLRVISFAALMVTHIGSFWFEIVLHCVERPFLVSTSFKDSNFQDITKVVLWCSIKLKDWLFGLYFQCDCFVCSRHLLLGYYGLPSLSWNMRIWYDSTPITPIMNSMKIECMRLFVLFRFHVSESKLKKSVCDDIFCFTFQKVSCRQKNVDATLLICEAMQNFTKTVLECFWSWFFLNFFKSWLSRLTYFTIGLIYFHCEPLRISED